MHVFEAAPWVVAVEHDSLHRLSNLDPQGRQQAMRQLEAGASPKEVFGRSGESLPLDRVRAVEWVPQAKTVLIRGAWWRDPWRLAFDESGEGEQLFRVVAKLLPDAGAPQESRVGPHDLALDPGLIFWLVIALCGFLGLIGGALEGVGQAPMLVFEWLFRLLGRELGLAAVIGVAMLSLVAGICGLVWWHRHRPMKVVVRARAKRVLQGG
jgi:hypothetical protein